MRAAKVKALHQGRIFIIIWFIIIVIILQNVCWTTYFQQVHQIWVHNAQIFEFYATAVFLIPSWRDEQKVDCGCLSRSALGRVEARGRRRLLLLEESSSYSFSRSFVPGRSTQLLAAAEASPRHLQFTLRLTPEMTAGRQLWPHSGG